MEEESIHNTILIDDYKSNNKENEDIFEIIFNEIKENYKSVDGETKDEKEEETKDTKEEKNTKIDEETRKKTQTNLGSFEVIDEIKNKGCNDSDTDDS